MEKKRYHDLNSLFLPNCWHPCFFSYHHDLINLGRESFLSNMASCFGGEHFQNVRYRYRWKSQAYNSSMTKLIQCVLHVFYPWLIFMSSIKWIRLKLEFKYNTSSDRLAARPTNYHLPTRLWQTGWYQYTHFKLPLQLWNFETIVINTYYNCLKNKKTS